MISGFLTRKIKIKVERVKSDPQRSKFFGLEREFIGSSIYHKVARKDLQVLANHACSYYGVPTVVVVVYDNPKLKEFGESVVFSTDDWRTKFGRQIRLNRGYHGANLSTLLHELAHYISDVAYPGCESHGREFVGIYMHLLDKYRILPSVAFRALAKKWRVRIVGRFKPDAIRG